MHQALDLHSRPGLLEVAWVLSSHTILGLAAPIYGPVLETVSRMLAMAVRMFDAVGMVSRPFSAELVSRKVDSTLSCLEQRQNQPLLEQKEVRFKAERKKRGASRHLASAAAETGLVAAVEVELKEALKPATDEAKAALSEEVFNGLMTELAAEFASMAIDAALPLGGAVITAACMPHAYRCARP